MKRGKKYQDAAKEIKKLTKARDKIIVLHNTVKIRYVNNTNLLSYMYTKYDKYMPVNAHTPYMKDFDRHFFGPTKLALSLVYVF